MNASSRLLDGSEVVEELRGRGDGGDEERFACAGRCDVEEVALCGVDLGESRFVCSLREAFDGWQDAFVACKHCHGAILKPLSLVHRGDHHSCTTAPGTAAR